jgi:AcrR family transcriptional regulator
VPVQKRASWETTGDVEEKRTEILRSLGHVMRDRKHSSPSMQSIADEVGITRTNLYYYFRDKQDIFFHCHLRIMEGSLRALDHVNAMDGKASDRLRTLLVMHIRSILDDSYGAVVLTDLEGFSAAQKRKYFPLRDKFERGVRRLIEEGIDAGEFPARSVNLAGFAILGGVNWISKWFHPDGQESSATIANVFADFYVAGLKGPIEPSSPEVAVPDTTTDATLKTTAPRKRR